MKKFGLLLSLSCLFLVGCSEQKETLFLNEKIDADESFSQKQSEFIYPWNCPYAQDSIDIDIKPLFQGDRGIQSSETKDGEPMIILSKEPIFYQKLLKSSKRYLLDDYGLPLMDCGHFLMTGRIIAFTGFVKCLGEEKENEECFLTGLDASEYMRPVVQRQFKPEQEDVKFFGDIGYEKNGILLPNNQNISNLQHLVNDGKNHTFEIYYRLPIMGDRDASFDPIKDISLWE